MKPKTMTFYIDTEGRYWDRVHDYGFKEICETWIEEWEQEGIVIILLKKPIITNK